MSNSITSSVIKKLYGLSAGKCNICKISLFENEVHVGEMAHVIAKKSGGARGDALRINDNSYDNLILLCANHHSEVDQNPEHFTVDLLKAIKKEHEDFIANSTDFSSFAANKRESDIVFLNAYFYYTPFFRMLSFLSDLPYRHHIYLLEFEDQFENILKDLPFSYPLNDESLQKNFENFINAIKMLDRILCGYIEHNGRTICIFDSANNGYYCKFNGSDLPFDKADLIEDEIYKVKDALYFSYRELISYIRMYYPEVKMSSPNF
ncbi:HNH endonuclease [Pantoea sp. FN0305]|uniref:HNH endonuclease n=1 Tax=Pantoea sp. FN0305 TaxID=3418559 RepID=UPI003CF10F06